MRKTRILIASVLKPVNDPRMFEKVGKSLAKLPDSEVHIAGFSAKNLSIFPNIVFHPIFSFYRISWQRFAAQWKYYKLLLQLKPEVIIPNTFELLPVTLLYRIFYSPVILYDVRENYYANIRFQPTFPKAFRWLLATGVRLAEKLAAPFITHFFLAEKSYKNELTFIGPNHTVLENKFKPDALVVSSKFFPVRLSGQALNLLYSGTISEIYGIWEAINLAQGLHTQNPAIRLTIIGFCPQAETYHKLKAELAVKPFITLIGGLELVPHSKIVAAIEAATVGLLPYRYNQSTATCIPTKLFEYLANGLPVLIPQNPGWEEIVEKNTAGFSIDFQNPNPEEIQNRLISGTFYPEGPPKDVFWQTEEEKLLSVLSKII